MKLRYRLCAAGMLLFGAVLPLPLHAQLADPPPAASGATEPAPSPMFLPVDRIGITGRNQVPAMAPVSEAERAAFQSYITGLPRFPAYLFSGCHDRAHAAYLLLPDSLKDRVAKLWVLSPSKYTAALPGFISLTNPPQGAENVQWDYHVALSYLDGDQVMVFDPALAPDRVLTREEWFSEMTFPQPSIWTLSQGNVYMFYTTQTDQYSVNRDIWSGNSSGYSGSFVQRNFIPEALARDAVGAAIANRNACPALLSEISEPTDLLTRLQKNDLPGECRDLAALFQGERSTWIRRLSSR